MKKKQRPIWRPDSEQNQSLNFARNYEITVLISFLLDNDDDGGDDDGGGDDNDVDISFARQHHQELPLQNWPWWPG